MIDFVARFNASFSTKSFYAGGLATAAALTFYDFCDLKQWSKPVTIVGGLAIAFTSALAVFVAADAFAYFSSPSSQQQIEHEDEHDRNGLIAVFPVIDDKMKN
jgi:hypothetical protein